MKEKCSIIRDLLPSYIENLVSDETKQYIDSHISKCAECQQILKDMQGDNCNEVDNILEKEAEKRTIKIIKRHRRIKCVLRIVAILFIAIVAISSIYFGTRFIPINSIRLKTYNKLQELKKMDNYKLTVEKTANVLDGIKEVETTTYYYKNGKYREECHMDLTIYYKNGNYIAEGLKQKGEHTIKYYSDGSSNVVTIDKENENINTTTAYTNIEKGQILNELYNYIMQYSKSLSSQISMAKVFDLRDDTYNNKDYYVLTKVYDEVKTMYEYWINKETMMIDRELCKQENSSYADEQYKYNIYDYKYTIEPNVVIDADVTIQHNN